MLRDGAVSILEQVLRITDRFEVAVDSLIYTLSNCGPFERTTDRYCERVAVSEFDSSEYRGIIDLHKL